MAMAMEQPLSDQQCRQFEELGYTMVDGPWMDGSAEGEAFLQRCEATFDRLTAPEAERKVDKEEDEGFIEMISHPFFESVAKQMLRSEHVHIVEDGPHHRPAAEAPAVDDDGFDAHAAWKGGAHIDLQVTTSDFNATPRRDMLALWFWIVDVEPETAAMRILPRSHRAIHEHWEKTLQPERRSLLPRVHGLFPSPSKGYPSYPEYIPTPPDFPYTDMEPTPVVAKRGQAQVFTQSMLHSSWRNTDVRARKGFIISWMAKDVPCGFTSDRCEGLRKHFPRLAKSLKAWQPGREHIVPTEEEFIHFHSNYEPCVHPSLLPEKANTESIRLVRHCNLF